MKLSKQRILITGHTGFIGSWLYYFLKKKNLIVFGIGLKPKKKSDLFYKLKLNNDKNSKLLNILNYKKLQKHIKETKPNIIFHLAAESLVLDSIKKPNIFYRTNIIGTLNILNLIRKHSFIKTAIFFTTDKVYRNNNSKKKFSENDPLGGDDPYSGSKSASEMVINSYTKSFLKNKKILIFRCGNIIGGGDTSENRIIPDIIKSINKKKILILRNAESTRPWQHILDVIFLLFKIIKKINNKKKLFETFNMSPNSKSEKVKKIFFNFREKFDFKFKILKRKNFETKNLELNSNKIFREYKLKNYFSSKQSINEVVKFYDEILLKKKKIQDTISEQIINYECKTKNL
jgi:CDP-glucose 4,6-dehydratase